ncbi:MAG TPA: hypothetical protein VL087_07215 [Nitrospirota bacterium]|nr:hypothetical protein [Nitrospirota bacterium]
MTGNELAQEVIAGRRTVRMLLPLRFGLLKLRGKEWANRFGY